MEEGTVVRLQKDRGFGFIEIEGMKDAYFKTRYTPDIENGDRVQCEVDGPAERPNAKKVKILLRADGTPYVAGQVKAEAPQEIAVDFDFFAPRLVQIEEYDEDTGETKPVQKLQLPVWVIATRGTRPALNVEVALMANGEIVRQPEVQTWTGKDGKAFFRVLLEENADDCNLSASLESKSYTRFWQKNPPQAGTEAGTTTGTSTETTTATDAEKEIEVVNPPRDPDPTTGKFIVNVVTRMNGKKTNRDFAYFCDQTITVEQEAFGWLTLAKTFTADPIGQYKLYVDFPGVMVKIVFRLDNGNEAAVWLRK